MVVSDQFDASIPRLSHEKYPVASWVHTPMAYSHPPLNQLVQSFDGDINGILMRY